MSRTDVHRPVWVMENDPTVRHWFADFHDHTRDGCDLEAYLAAKGWIRTRCYRQLWTQAPNVCGCRLCTGRHGRMLARRQERAAWRATARQLLTAARSGERCDLDAPPPARGSAWQPACRIMDSRPGR